MSRDSSSHFGFGIEAEFLLVEKDSCNPLWIDDLNAQDLLNLVDSIYTEDLSIAGFNIKPLHKKAGHYLIEGYTLTDEQFKPQKLLPKGIELRTPMSNSIDQSINLLSDLYLRLNRQLNQAGLAIAIISHHPTKSNLQAAENYARHDYWQWALTATSTYGPDINISLPPALANDVDQNAMYGKVNHYMPSLIALSLASPLLDGNLWRIRGRIGKSIRTYRRSLWAPIYYVHEKPALRFEFKGFEMARCLDDYNAFFLMSLALLLDKKLTGTASDQSRIYDLGDIAVNGLASELVCDRAKYVLTSAEQIAGEYGFKTNGLAEMWRRLESKRLPADDIIDIFLSENSIPETLRHLQGFYSGFAKMPPNAIVASSVA